MSQSAQKNDEASSSPEPAADATQLAPWLQLVHRKVQSLHYGVVQVVVHDSQVVQVESTERHRFDLRRAS